MIGLFKNIFFLFFFSFSSLYASQKEANNIASISAVSLYNINKTALQETVKAYIRNNKSLKALRIVETLSNETYINVYKENGKVIFNKPFPKGVNQYNLYTATSSFENEEVGTIYAYYEKVKSKNLNEEEISWIKKNQVIKIAVVKDYEPYDMVDENNKLHGFHSSIVKLINDKLGSNIILIPFSSWKDAYTASFTGELNGIFSLSWSKEREDEYFIYSPAYHFTPYHLLVHKNTKDINSLSSLKYKKVAIETSTIFSKVIKDKVPQAKIVYFNQTNDLYESVKNGSTDAAFSANLDEKVLSKYELKVATEVYHESSELYIGVSKKYPLVASIITKGINSISLKEMGTLRKQWFVEYSNIKSAKFRKKSAKDTMLLTPKEKMWIENNPIVKLAVMNFWNTNDKGESIHSDLIKLINKYSNLHVVSVKYDIWKKGFRDASKGDFIHGIMNLSWTKQREQNSFDYTKPYNFTPSQLIIRESDKSIKSIDDLKNKTIYLRENSISHKTIDEQTPSTKIIDVTSKTNMYKKLATTNEADAILDYGYKQDKLKKYKLKIVQNVYNRYSEVSVGVSKQHKELKSILHKIYQVIPKSELLNIQSKVYEKENLYKLKLTKKERAFIQNHKPIKVGGEMDWAPFDFVDISGEYQGIAKEYLSQVSKISGLKFDVITGQTWSELLQSFKDKKLDVLPVLYHSKERESFINYTRPYYNLNQYFFLKEDENSIDNINSLKGKTLAVVAGYYTVDILKKEFPQIKLYLVQNVAQCLNSVIQNKSNACIESLAPASYAIEQEFITGLKVGARVHFAPTKIHMGITKENKILRDIIDKSLKAITLKQRTQIKNKWINLKPSSKEDKELNIAFHYDRPPYMFGKTSSKGIEADLVKEVFSTQGYKVNVHQMGKTTMENLLKDNANFDAVASVSDNGDGMYYSDKYSLYEDYAITRKEDNIKIDSLKDLSKYNFVSWKNAYNDLGKDFYKYFNPIDGVSKKAYHDRTSQKEQHKLFFNKQIDVIVVDKMIFSWYKKSLNNNEEYTFHKILPLASNSVTKFKNKKLRDIFNKGLKQIRKNGRYKEIVDFYINQDIRPLLKYSNLLADISGKYVFSHEPKSLEKILEKFFSHPDIMHIEVFDSASNKNMVMLHKKSHQQNDKKKQKDFFSSITKDIYYTEQGNPLSVGRLKVVYKVKGMDLNQALLIPALSEFNQFDLKTFIFLEKEYVKFGYSNLKIDLSNAEKVFLSNHPTIRVHNEKNWPPFNFYEFGQPKGYSVDLMKLVANNIGLDIEFITGPTWDEFLKMMKKDELDVFINIVKNEERSKYMLFTDPFIQATMGVAVHKDTRNIKSFNDILDKKVALENGFFYHDYFNKSHPSTQLLVVDDGVQTLQSVAFKKADATIGFIPVMKYISEKNFITELNYFTDSSSSIMKPMPLRFSTSKDAPGLLSILQKGLASITPEQRKELNNRWFSKSGEDKKVKINLTKQEKNWLDKQNEIHVGIQKSWAPISYLENKSPQGLSVDYLNLINKNLDGKIKIIADSFKENLQKLKNGTLDAIVDITPNKQREKKYHFTSKYADIPHYIISTKKNKEYYNNINDLKGKVVAVEKGYGINKLLQKVVPNVKLKYYRNTSEALDALSNNEVQAYVGNRAVINYHIEKNFITNLKFHGKSDISRSVLAIATNKDKKILRDIIQKVLNAISNKDKKALYENYVRSLHDKKIKLSLKEQAWIDKKIPIKYVYDSDWAPFEWKNELNEHTGITYDILKIISERTGMTFQAVPTETWGEAVKLAETKQVDMYGGLGENKERKKYMNFTKNTLYKTPYVLVAHKDYEVDHFDTFNSLTGNEKIAVVDGYTIQGIMNDRQPNMKLLAVASTMDGFKQVAEKKIDMFLVNASTAKYYINRKGFDTLKIATKTEYKLELKPAIRDDWPPEVISIIDKALESISKKELADIYLKWTEVLVEKKIDWELIYEIAGGALALLLLVAYWNRKLKKAVDKKTSELQKLLASFDENVIASKTNSKGIIQYVSKAFCKISGYTAEELIGSPQNIVRHPDMPHSVFKDLWSTLEKGKIWRGEIKNKKKDGGFYWVDVIIKPEFDEEGKITGYSAIRQDITSKKEVEELSSNLEIKVEERTAELNESQEEIKENKLFVDTLLDSQEQMVITTDGKILKSCNKAFLEFFSIEKIEEFLEVDDCICDRFEPDLSSTYLQKYMGELAWIEYVLAHEDKTHKAVIVREGKEKIFTVSAAVLPIGDSDLKSAVFTDITEIEDIRKNIEMILSNIMLPVLITSKKERKILYANEYASKQYESSIDELIGSSIDTVYTSLNQREEILNIISKDGYIENLEEKYKTKSGKEFIGLLSVKPIMYNFEESFIGMVVDITEQKEIEHELKRLHKHTTDSIEYASLIQQALIPEDKKMTNYFNDFFTIWQPKDIVGGDIFLFEELRNKDECLLMVIDCTGHGVPGAFVTMLVKAIERQVVANIQASSKEVSPALILEYFNVTMKKLLKQENEDAISNAGFDGGILYYNKKENYIKYAGAETPLFYIQNNELKIIKTNRHSIGYKKSDVNYKFDEYKIDIDVESKFYISTDGYFDQNGGEKGFPFGKKQFQELIIQNNENPFKEQKEILLEKVESYKGNEERNDDTTVVGFKICP